MALKSFIPQWWPLNIEGFHDINYHTYSHACTVMRHRQCGLDITVDYIILTGITDIVCMMSRHLSHEVQRG